MVSAVYNATDEFLKFLNTKRDLDVLGTPQRIGLKATNDTLLFSKEALLKRSATIKITFSVMVNNNVLVDVGITIDMTTIPV